MFNDVRIGFIHGRPNGRSGVSPGDEEGIAETGCEVEMSPLKKGLCVITSRTQEQSQDQFAEFSDA